MNGLSTGMEKFSHLEDKIYLTIELVKKLREERDSLERELRELKAARADLSEKVSDESERLTELLAERDAIQMKVLAMLDALAEVDPEIASSAAA